MTALRRILSLRDIASNFDVIVFDQWGVLHNGSTAYAGAVAAVEALTGGAVQLAVLSNSGKRSEPNRKRIVSMGFPSGAFTAVMTSGEALWLDFAAEKNPGIRRLFPLTAAQGDAELWARGLPEITFTEDIEAADAILLMGLPEEIAADEALQPALALGLHRQLPMFCSNPDKASPRQGGKLVRSPGALAETYRQAGGTVHFYGKPYRAVFESLQRHLGIADPARLLMIGDSLEHDVAGAAAAGWRTLFIEGGLHAADFGHHAERRTRIAELGQQHCAPLPDFHMELLAW